jgi:hypothetical protein
LLNIPGLGLLLRLRRRSAIVDLARSGLLRICLLRLRLWKRSAFRDLNRWRWPTWALSLLLGCTHIVDEGCGLRWTEYLWRRRLRSAPSPALGLTFHGLSRLSLRMGWWRRSKLERRRVRTGMLWLLWRL